MDQTLNDNLDIKSKKNNYIYKTFLDISLLFKNFVHWNISKLIIFLWWIILWLLPSLPFIWLLYLYIKTSWLDVINLLTLNIFVSFWPSIFAFIFAFIVWLIYLIFFWYSYLLLINLTNSYINWDRLWYKKNDYFNMKKIIKFFNLSLINAWILLIPIIFFVLFSIILVLIIWQDTLSSVLTSWYNVYIISWLIAFIISFIAFLYLYYRLVFSYFIFADTNYYDSEKKVTFYLKESFKKTKNIKTFFKYMLLFVIFAIIIFPFDSLNETFNKKERDFSVYSQYLTLKDKNKSNLNSEEYYYIEYLKEEYWDLSEKELDKKRSTNNLYITLYSIFDFLFLYWLLVMLTSSFYRRELV